MFDLVFPHALQHVLVALETVCCNNPLGFDLLHIPLQSADLVLDLFSLFLQRPHLLRREVYFISILILLELLAPDVDLDS